MPFDATPQFDLDALCERDEVLRVLVEADRLLSGPEKWCKGDLRDGEAMCMEYAIGIHDSRDISDATVAAFCFLSALIGVAPSTWQDERNRTFSDVKNLLAKAITERARLVQGGAV